MTSQRRIILDNAQATTPRSDALRNHPKVFLDEYKSTRRFAGALAVQPGQLLCRRLDVVFEADGLEADAINHAHNRSDPYTVRSTAVLGTPIATGRNLSAPPVTIDAFANDLVGWIAMDGKAFIRRVRRAAARRGSCYGSLHHSRADSSFFPSALSSFGH
jgi:hypothetical protein